MLLFFLMGIAILAHLPHLQAPISHVSERHIHGQIGFDKLKVTDIIIGVEPYERVISQDILIDMRVMLDLQKVTQTDDLTDTVDYVKLADLAKVEADQGKHFFIDTLAIDIIQKTFETYPEVDEVTIRIQKPKALPNAKSGGLVEISISRDQFENSDQLFGQIGFEDLYIYTIIVDLQEERDNQQDLFVN